jgi:hypothetical protein
LCFQPIDVVFFVFEDRFEDFPSSVVAHFGRDAYASYADLLNEAFTSA